MAALDKLKKKNEPQVSVALMRMKPMSRKEAVTDSMSYRDNEDDMGENGEMPENEEEYGSESCPKCAEYQMLIGEAITMYMRNKDKEEASDSDME